MCRFTFPNTSIEIYILYSFVLVNWEVKEAANQMQQTKKK